MRTAAGKFVGNDRIENTKEHRVNSPKAIVKQTVSKDFDNRPPLPPGSASGGTLGSKVGAETHIEITPERIRVRAYEIYQARNGNPGDPESDWCQAARELNGTCCSESAASERVCDEPSLEIKTRTQSPVRADAGIRGGL